MAGILQADFEVLAECAVTAGRQAQAVQHMFQRVQGQARRVALTWEGQGAAAFQDELQREVIPALQRLIAALNETQRVVAKSSELLRHAEAEAAALFRGEAALDGVVTPLPFVPAGGGLTPIPLGAPPGEPAYGTREWAQQGMLREAGVDPRFYDPAKGYDRNREAIERGYAYYQRLFQENPDFWWMGFAYSAVQKSIYPAFLMLDFLEDALRAYEQLDPPGLPFEDFLHRDAGDVLAAFLLGPHAPPEIAAVIAAMAEGRITADDIHAISTEFTRMQRDIFMDMGAAHYAYQQGGIELIRQMGANGEMDKDLVRAFEMLDEGRRTGNEALLAQAARLMADREQRILLQPRYNEIASMGEAGRLMLAAMSVMAVPAVPGGQMMKNAVPGGNIASEDQRMEWIYGEIDTWGQMTDEQRGEVVDGSLPQNIVEAGMALSPAWAPLIIDRILWG